MDPRLGRLLAVLVGVLSGAGAYAAYPDPLLAALTGSFWTAAGLLSRHNWRLVHRRGSRWAGVYGGLSTLAVIGAFAFARSISLPAGLGYALGLFVLGVASAMTGVGVELAGECDPDRGRDAASEGVRDGAKPGR